MLECWSSTAGRAAGEKAKEEEWRTRGKKKTIRSPCKEWRPPMSGLLFRLRHIDKRIECKYGGTRGFSGKSTTSIAASADLPTRITTDIDRTQHKRVRVEN